MTTKLRTTRKVQFAAIAAAAALVLTACGGSDSDSNGGGDAGDEPTGEPIKIGVAASKTGPQSINGISSEAAAKAWAAQVNSEGGLGGRPIELKIIDSKNNATGAQAATRELVADEDVVAILLTDLVGEAAIGEELQAANIPVLSGGGSADIVWNQLSNFFQPVASGRAVVASLLPAAEAAGATNLAWAVCVEAGSCAEHAAALGPATADFGMTYSGEQSVSASAAGYTAECLAFKNKDVDVIGMIIGAGTGVRIITDCLQQGYEGIFATPSSGFDVDQFRPLEGAKMIGTLNGFPWWADAEPVARYRDAMAEYSSNVPATNSTATSAWAALELFKKAVGDDTETVTRESVFAGLRSLSDETLDGLLPQPITFTEGQPSPYVECLYAFTYTGGDENPESLAPTGESGNGQTGDLASTCIEGDIGKL